MSPEEAIARMLCARESPGRAWEEHSDDDRAGFLGAAGRIITQLHFYGYRILSLGDIP